LSRKEDAHCHREALEFGRHRHWLPETAQILAARRSRTDMGQFGVLAWHLALVITAIRLTDRLLALPSHALPPGDAPPLSRGNFEIRVNSVASRSKPVRGFS
jgi:hypothetical protein